MSLGAQRMDPHASLAGHAPIQLLTSLWARAEMAEQQWVGAACASDAGVPALPVPCTWATSSLHLSRGA